MKKCKLCKMTALFCAAFLTVCAFLWNMQSVQGDGDTALYYWGFENTTADLDLSERGRRGIQYHHVIRKYGG